MFWTHHMQYQLASQAETPHCSIQPTGTQAPSVRTETTMLRAGLTPTCSVRPL